MALGSEEHKDTKGRILDTAKLLFAERGFDATSVRGVTAEAGVNLAAVNYHFGSKAALLRAVVRRILAPANAERLRALGELEAGGRRPSAKELIEAFVSPVVGLLDHDDGKDGVDAGNDADRHAVFSATVVVGLARGSRPRILSLSGRIDNQQGGRRTWAK